MNNFLLELIIEPLDGEWIESAEQEIEVAFKNLLEMKSINFTDIVIIVKQTRIIITAKLDTESISSSNLTENIPVFLRAIESQNQMRWRKGSIAFYRPIINILCFLDNRLIPIEIEGVVSSNKTYIDDVEKIEINSYEDYFDKMNPYIGFDKKASISKLRSSINKAAASVGKSPDLMGIKFEKLYEFVESPTILTAAFEEELLDIPDSIIKAVLSKYNIIIPLLEDNDKLSNTFLIAVPASKNSSRIIEDYTYIINSELQNISRMFEEDKKLKLDEYVPRLNWFVKYQDLGNLYDKTIRIEKNVARVADILSLSEDMKQDLMYCSHILKADLATRIVRRHKSLRGTVGSEMLKEEGAKERVCLAIKEQYLPDEYENYPENTIGFILSICDKLDDVIGLMIIDSSLAKGGEYLKNKIDDIIRLLVKSNLKLSIYDLIDTTLYVYADESVGAFDYNTLFKALTDAFRLRVRNELRKLNVNSVLTSDELINSRKDYSTLFKTLKTLSEKADKDDINFINIIIGIREMIASKELNDGEKLKEEVQVEEIIDHVSDKCDEPFLYLKELRKYEKEIQALYDIYKKSDFITNYSHSLQNHLKDRWI